MAKKYGVPLVVRSSLNNSEGTVVKEVVSVERMLISGVALDTDAVRIAVLGLRDVPGVAFKAVSYTHLVITPDTISAGA